MEDLMEDETNLPFKEGQLTECKSFLKGYRGAWFRCKIKKISRKKGRLGHVLEYLDFPDEELKWTRIYQVTFHHEGDTKGKHTELMLRPCYPPIYNEKKMPHVSEISEVAVIVRDSWRVGDLVDWFTTGCYWSGTLTELLGPNKATVKLKPPPLGEGDSYKAFFKDLRPSLDWSPELGWTVPTQEGAGCPCARLIKPINQGRGAEGVQRSDGSVFPSPAPSGPAVSDEAKSRTETQTQTVSDKQERTASQGAVDSSTRKTSRVVAVSRQNGAEVKSRTTKMQTQTVSEKRGKQERSTSQVPVNSSSRKTSQVVADSRQNKLQKRKDRQEGSNSQGPVDSQQRKTSWVVADSRQSGAEVKSKTTEMQTQTVSEKPDKQERSTSQVPVDSSSRKTSRVVADSRQNKLQKRMDTQESSTSQGPVDSLPRETSRVVADSVQHGAGPAAEVVEEEPDPDSCQEKYRSTLNSKRSDTVEAAIMDLEEYVNKVKWLKKILRYGMRGLNGHF